MKSLSNLLLATTVLCGSLVSTSCDSSGNSDAQEQSDISKIPDETAQSLLSVVVGDTLVLNTTEGETLLDDTLQATSNIEFSTANVPLTYEKVSKHEFKLSGSVDIATNLRLALEGSLGSPAPLNAEIRSILLEKDYTRENLQRIVDILTPIGVDLIVHPTEDRIIGVESFEYFFRVESNNAALLDGSQAGIFSSRINYVNIKFRLATQAQVDGFGATESGIRLITPSHDIPFVDLNDSELLNTTQAGLFTLTLVNRPITVAP